MFNSVVDGWMLRFAFLCNCRLTCDLSSSCNFRMWKTSDLSSTPTLGRHALSAPHTAGCRLTAPFQGIVRKYSSSLLELRLLHYEWCDCVQRSLSWKASAHTAFPALHGTRRFITEFTTAHHIKRQVNEVKHSRTVLHFFKIRASVILRTSCPRWSLLVLKPHFCLHLSSWDFRFSWQPV
jgi:hypothetical protein